MNATASTRELVTDETEFMQRHLPLAGAHVVELGCGNGAIARKLLQRGQVAAVTALEVDRLQHADNLADPPLPGLVFLAGGADAIPLPDACCDVVTMLKSLHHVPIERMDAAFAEIRRILRPGGVVYVSEPVYAGDFNDVVKLFHDEGTVRAAAYAALQRAARDGVLAWADEIVFDSPIAFRDFDDFVQKLTGATHTDIRMPEEVRPAVRRSFERFMTPQGARFVRQMRVNLLRKPAD